MYLILYSKPGCHLCEGLQEKLEHIQADSNSSCKFELEIRDITTREDWFNQYQYEVPVLYKRSDSSALEEPLPRPSPRISTQQLEQRLSEYSKQNKN